MFKKVLIVFVLLSFPLFAYAQGSSEKSILKYIHKQHFIKAHAGLKRLYKKDTSSVPANYLYAYYYFQSQNPDFQIDSAYQYTLKSLAHYKNLSGRERDKLNRSELDSMALVVMRQRIDSAAFVDANDKHTVEAYNKFLQRHAGAADRPAAEKLRDHLAYDDAVSENNAQAFSAYIAKYPDATHIPEARKNYERLLYEEQTSDQHLESFERFLNDFPQSPLRKEAERKIFFIATAPGRVSDFSAFIDRYPDNSFVSRAVDFLYHLMEEEHPEVELAQALVSDSLAAVMQLSKAYLIPVLKQDKFGFMTSDGTTVIAESELDIDDGYLCGNITEDLLVLQNRVVSRNGMPIWNGIAESLDELGHGFVKVESDDGFTVLHKSGYKIHESFVDDAKILDGRLIALKKNNKWGLTTLTGSPLMSFDWDDVSLSGEVVIFNKDGRYNLSTVQVLTTDGLHPPRLAEGFDEVRNISEDLIWVRAGEFQGIYNSYLELVVNLDRHILQRTFFGFTAHSSSGNTVFNKYGKASEQVERIEVQEPWVGLKKNKTWRLFDPINLEYRTQPFDSLMLLGPFAVGVLKDSLLVHNTRGNFLKLKAPAKFEFIPAPDSTAYLLIEQRDKQTLYNKDGIRLFTASFDRIQYAGGGYFIVSKKQKKGLIDSKGKLILPVEYDAIGSLSKGAVSLLKNARFGLYNVQSKKLIKPEYEKNIVGYGDRIYTAFKSSGFGFLDENSKSLSKFVYDEIEFWKDSIAWVRQDGEWKLLNFYSGEEQLNKISEIKFIMKRGGESITRVKQGNNYGVMSAKDGVVIPINFSDIVNVGSAVMPTYFTEKHVAEASVFVVIYYDFKGKFLRKEIYERDDYEKIYCAQ